MLYILLTCNLSDLFKFERKFGTRLYIFATYRKSLISRISFEISTKYFSLRGDGAARCASERARQRQWHGEREGAWGECVARIVFWQYAGASIFEVWSPILKAQTGHLPAILEPFTILF